MNEYKKKLIKDELKLIKTNLNYIKEIKKPSVATEPITDIRQTFKDYQPYTDDTYKPYENGIYKPYTETINTTDVSDNVSEQSCDTTITTDTTNTTNTTNTTDTTNTYKIKPFVCSTCGYKTRYSSAFKKHITNRMKPCYQKKDQNYLFGCELNKLKRFKENDYIFNENTFANIQELCYHIDYMKKFNIPDALLTEIETKFNVHDKEQELLMLIETYNNKLNEYKRYSKYYKQKERDNDKNMLFSMLFKIHELSNKNDDPQYKKKYIEILNELLDAIK